MLSEVSLIRNLKTGIAGYRGGNAAWLPAGSMRMLELGRSKCFLRLGYPSRLSIFAVNPTCHVLRKGNNEFAHTHEKGFV